MRRNKRAARFPLSHEMDGRPLRMRDLALGHTYRIEIQDRWRGWKPLRRRAWVSVAGVRHPIKISGFTR